MPSLSGRYDVSIGPLVNVIVAPIGIIIPGAPPAAPVNGFPALIDTGASSTCISPIVVQTVNLQPVGMQPMTSATQSIPVNVYLVDLVLPFGGAALILNSVQVMEFTPLSGSPYQMLLGRDILCRGVFTLSFDGHFSFSV
jgi:hypothetical protein